jgi:hypothetical protein
VLLKSLSELDLMEFNFTIFKANVWKILIFECILLLKIQKNWVWKENLVEPSTCSHCRI